MSTPNNLIPFSSRRPLIHPKVRAGKPADPKAGNGMAYLGDRPTDYSGFYELKTDLEDPLPAWNHYIRFAKALAEAPIETLDKTLSPF